MLKNTSSQKLCVYVFDSTTNLPKTGDAANLTAYVNKDYAGLNVLTDTSATEVDATNAKGFYLFDLSQSETNADILQFSCKSSTANMVSLPMPAVVFTRPASFTSFVTPTGAAVNATQIGGQTASASGTVTFPNATLASTTNITAGTITTVTNLTNAPTAGDLTATMKSSVNAEVLDVLNTDTFAEPGQEAPGATVSLVKKIGYLYKFLRNKKTQTATTLSIFADDATTVDQKATISDDGTTYTHGEVASGP